MLLICLQTRSSMSHAEAVRVDVSDAKTKQFVFQAPTSFRAWEANCYRILFGRRKQVT